MKSDRESFEEMLKSDLPSAPKEEMEWDIARVLSRVRAKNDGPANEPIDYRIAAFERASSSFSWRRVALIPAAAAVVLGVFLAITWQDAFAVVEKADGTLYRVVDGKNQAIRAGDRVPAGTPVRTDKGAGAVLKLQDGARVEMHPKSEVILEHADNGTRIRLNDGSVNVTPSKDASGALFVQNRETTVPVVAALFQTAQAPPAEPRLAFEVASIRPSNPGGPAPGARGGGANPAGNGCGGPGMPQVDPRLFVAANFSLFNLISKAYPEWAGPVAGCMGVIESNLLTGGENWMRTELWDIRATMPDGNPSYTGSQFWEGKAPEIQKMLQTLLAERFKLVLRKETKMMPVYFLTVARGGPKFNGLIPGMNSTNTTFIQDGKKAGPAEARGVSMSRIGKDQNGKYLFLYNAINLTMADFAKGLISEARRVVVDRTGLTGEYSFHLETGMDPTGLMIPGVTDNAAARPKMTDAIEDVGLKLEAGTAPLEVWTVVQAERPSEN
jgi:uncharacterized protein (TIGR03435 family)